MQFYLAANIRGGIYLRWNDWGGWNGVSFGGSGQDYDLYLYYWNGSSWVQFLKSTNIQSGWQWPTEGLSGFYSTGGTTWGIAIRKSSATKNVQFNLLFTSGSSFEYNVPAGSLSAPADSPYAAAVGATDWKDDSYHSYSSQGPTADGRIKPDLCAPAGVSSVSYGEAVLNSFLTDGIHSPTGFFGTSASTPHVAGFIGTAANCFHINCTPCLPATFRSF